MMMMMMRHARAKGGGSLHAHKGPRLASTLIIVMMVTLAAGIIAAFSVSPQVRKSI